MQEIAGTCSYWQLLWRRAELPRYSKFSKLSHMQEKGRQHFFCQLLSYAWKSYSFCCCTSAAYGGLCHRTFQKRGFFLFLCSEVVPRTTLLASHLPLPNNHVLVKCSYLNWQETMGLVFETFLLSIFTLKSPVLLCSTNVAASYISSIKVCSDFDL